MGKAGSKLTRALGFGRGDPDEEAGGSTEPKPPQWDTTIDQLFGDAPPDENVIGDVPIIDAPIRPRRRRRAPPPPPPRSILNGGGRRRPLPSSPSRSRRNRRGAPQAMRTPVIPDMPRRSASRGIQAVNAPFGVNRRPMVVPAPIIPQEAPARVILSSHIKRRPSTRRRRRPPSLQRNQRWQELLQCPVCLTPYTEPRLLPCGHTYCHECLNRLIQNDQDVVTCPECRKQHLVPEDGIFPPNFVVRNLLDEQDEQGHCDVVEAEGFAFVPIEMNHLGAINQDRFTKRTRHSSGKTIQFYIAVRKITRSHSQVKRLTIEMPMGNYLRDTCETLIRRIAEREQLQSTSHQLVLEFGDKRLRHQRTLASYGVQHGDLLFLFDPDQRLNFLTYDDQEDEVRPLPSIPTLSSRGASRGRTNSYNSSASDIRTATSNDATYNRINHRLGAIADHDDQTSSLYSDS